MRPAPRGSPAGTPRRQAAHGAALCGADGGGLWRAFWCSVCWGHGDLLPTVHIAGGGLKDTLSHQEADGTLAHYTALTCPCVSLYVLYDEHLSWGISQKSMPILAEIEDRKSQGRKESKRHRATLCSKESTTPLVSCLEASVALGTSSAFSDPLRWMRFR